MLYSVYYSSSILTFLFFFNSTATSYIYTLSLHDALPIFLFYFLNSLTLLLSLSLKVSSTLQASLSEIPLWQFYQDRKSTRLNSSHVAISYAVFCLKKKN